MHIQRTLTEIMKDSNDFDHIKINYPDLRATFYTQGFEFNKFRGDDHFEELDEMEEQEKNKERIQHSILTLLETHKFNKM